ncbi:MAG: hypothetical protein HDR49_00155, partial [Bacteroides sp.]|nr:hypothetical protein [Bacteroides sp.]
MGTESSKWLYDQLTKRGYNVGKDQAEFDSLMSSNDESRRWAFETARKSGLNVGADYDEFSSLVVGGGGAAPHADATPAARVNLNRFSLAPKETRDALRAGDGHADIIGRSRPINSTSGSGVSEGSGIAEGSDGSEGLMSGDAVTSDSNQGEQAQGNWQPTMQQRIAMAHDFNMMTAQGEAAMNNIGENSKRSFERFTPEGRRRQELARMKAVAHGIDPRLVGAVPEAPRKKDFRTNAEAGTDYFHIRRGGKNLLVPVDEVNLYGGLQGWADAHPGAPVRVYMEGDGFSGHVDLKEAHKRLAQKGYKYRITHYSDPEKEDAAVGSNTDEGGYAPTGVSPTLYDVVTDEDGKKVAQWLMPDGSLSTSRYDASIAEGLAQQGRERMRFEQRMKGSGLDPKNPEDVKKQLQADAEAEQKQMQARLGQIARDAVEAAWAAAQKRQREDENRNADKAWDNHTGGKEAGLVNAAREMFSDNVSHNKNFDLDRLMDDAWNRMDKGTRRTMVEVCSSWLKKMYPGARQPELRAAAEQMARGQSDMALYNYAVEQHAPKSTTEYIFRQAKSMNLINSLSEGVARSASGTTGDLAAKEQAMGQYGKEHWVANAVGTVGGMLADPVTLLTAPIGGAAANMATSAAGRLVGATLGRSAALGTRLVAKTTAGRLGAAAVGGGAGFGAYEMAKEAESQFVHGGHVNAETGENDGYSGWEIAKAGCHGVVMGAAVGGIPTLFGNVADKVVRATSNTVGKAAVRGGEFALSKLTEGTVFSIPEWISGEQDAFDVWRGNMALIGGFAATHGMKSAGKMVMGTSERLNSLRPIKPQPGRELTASERAHNNRTFMQKIGEMLDGNSGKFNPELEFTNEELDELRNAKYGSLADLFRSEQKADALRDKALRKEAKEKAKNGGGSTARDGHIKFDSEPIEEVEAETLGGEFDGFRLMDELMHDGNVSESTRAKAYYIVTGQKLQPSTVTGVRRIEAADGHIYIQSLNAAGEVVTSRRFKTERGARSEEALVYRQVELNSIDVGEKYSDAEANRIVLAKAFSEAVPDMDFESALKIYEKVKSGAEDVTAQEAAIVERMDHVISFYRNEGDHVRPASIRASVSSEYGIDVDQALKKERADRTKKEQEVVDEYTRRLYQSVSKGGLAEENPEYVNNRGGVSEYSEESDYSDGSEVQVDERVHRDSGEIIEATLKVGDRKVYIIKGDVVMNADGVGVDTRASSDMVRVRDAETGEEFFISPDRIASVSEPVAVSSDAVEMPAEQSMGVADSGVSVENMSEEFRQGYAMGLDTQDMTDEELADSIAEFEGIRDNTEDGLSERGFGILDGLKAERERRAGVATQMQGEEGVLSDEGEIDSETDVEDAENFVTSQYGNRSEQNNDGLAEREDRGRVAGDTAGSAEISTENEVSDAENASETASTVGNGEESALSRIPVDEVSGEPMFEAVDAETGWLGLLEAAQSDSERAGNIASKQADQARGELEALERKPPVRKNVKLKGSPMAMLKAEEEADRAYEKAVMEHAQKIEDAKSRYAAWREIVKVKTERERIEREERQRQAEAEEEARIMENRERLRREAEEREAAQSALKEQHEQAQRMAIEQLEDEERQRLQEESRAENVEKRLAFNNYEEAMDAERRAIIANHGEGLRSELAGRIQEARGGKAYGQIYGALDGDGVATLEEWVARNLSLGGRRVQWNGHGNLGGQIFGSSEGDKVSERRQYGWMTSDSGESFYEFVHKMWETLMGDESVQFNRADVTDMDVRNMVIDLLRNHPTSRGLFEHAIDLYDSRTMSEGARDALAEMEHYEKEIRDDWYNKNYGLSFDDYEARVENIYEELSRSKLSDEDAYEIASMIADEQAAMNNNNITEYETGNDGARQSSSEILHGQQPDRGQRDGTVAAGESASTFGGGNGSGRGLSAEASREGIAGRGLASEEAQQSEQVPGRSRPINSTSGSTSTSKKEPLAKYDRTVPATPAAQRSAISRIIDIAKKVKNRVERAVIGGITPRQAKDFANSGIEVDETWVHSFESSAVAHNQKHHGNDKTEAARGQIAITSDDYTRIPEILETYDKVSKSPNKTKGTENEVIIYEKAFDDGYVYYLEEKRDNRKSLSFQTMYKKKKGTDSSDGFAAKSTAPITPIAPSDNLNSYSDGKGNTLSVEKQPNGAESSNNISIKEPTEAQKQAGNYPMEHRHIDGYRISIENPRGSVRRGTDANGTPWATTMQHDYGYIRGTEGVDGDHIDVFLSDAPEEGDVFVVDQYNTDGSFDEHKVMYGFGSEKEAREAYLSNYSDGWENGRRLDITHVSKDEFKKWVQSSKRKTKPFSEYKSVTAVGGSNTPMPTEKVSPEATRATYSITPSTYTNKAGKSTPMHSIQFSTPPTYEQRKALAAFAREKADGELSRGWCSDKHTYSEWLFRSEEDARKAGEIMAGSKEQNVKNNHASDASEKKGVSLKSETKSDKTKKPKENETETDIQSRSGSAERDGGHEHQPNEPLGESQRNATEGSDRRGVDKRGVVDSLSDQERGRGVSRLAESKSTIGHSAVSEGKNIRNNHAERGVDYAPKGEDARIKANIEAIELAKRLLDAGEAATPEQMAVLRKFSGWGGLGKAFDDKGESPTSKRLRALLAEKGYQDAVDSRRSAYYTPANVIDAMWDVARALGFKGGNVLEGSAGIGNILGLMPAEMSERSSIHAVEIDSTTGGILSLLYPDAQVDIQGFEKTKVRNNSVDLAITNVPFITGARVFDETGDKDLSKKFRDIHDFCIAKNIRKLREGGLGIFITSSGTMDNSKELRRWIGNEGNADVVGAFRMHNKTFGGTGATSDIIVVRKRVNGKPSPNAIDVTDVTGVRVADYDTGETRMSKGQLIPIVKQLPMTYNKYFAEHPECMAGEMMFNFERGETRFPTSSALFPSSGKPQEKMLSEWARKFATMKEEKPTRKVEDEAIRINEKLGEGTKEGSMVLNSKGELCMARMGEAVPIGLNKNKVKGHTKAECFEDYTAIKKALSDVLEYQSTNDDNAGLEPLLKELNRAFDAFTKKYGNLHKNTAISFLRNDVDFSSILALETYSEKGDKNGNKVVSVGKTDVFSRRVVETEKELQPTTVKDGILASLYKSGGIDVEYISETLGMAADDVKREIVKSGLGYENPSSGLMEVSYQYLSGNVREKLHVAQENNENGKYDANIAALEKVLPMTIPAHLIEFSLGSSWIEPKLYEDFVKEKTGIQVTLTNVGGTWFMKTPWSTFNEKNRAMAVTSTMCGKTIMGHELIEAAITNRQITVSKQVKRYNGATETITDKAATAECSTKIDEIRSEFKDWARERMQSDAEMSARIEQTYNDQFNNYVPMSIPDEFVPQHFGGQVSELHGQQFALRPHQGKAVVRGTTEPILLAHEVGTGKTYTLITTAMEMRRLG